MHRREDHIVHAFAVRQRNLHLHRFGSPAAEVLLHRRQLAPVERGQDLNLQPQLAVGRHRQQVRLHFELQFLAGANTSEG